jgi:gliding motility-associated-like protein
MIAQGVGGCKDTSIQCIHLEKRTDVSYSVPNVFSPNGDGSNDFFYITNAGLKSLVCTIYDRWGRQLYEINSLNGKWDGRTAGGVKLSDGVYYYLLTVQTQAGAVKQEKGFVQLIMN